MGDRVPLRCAACGPVQVDPSVVEVHRNHRTGFRLVAFGCPNCANLEVASVCDEQVATLLDAGARDRELRSTCDPALTLDDLLDLHRWLATDPDWSTGAGTGGVAG